MEQKTDKKFAATEYYSHDENLILLKFQLQFEPFVYLKRYIIIFKKMSFHIWEKLLDIRLNIYQYLSVLII